MLQLTILGSNAASPAFNRHPTAQVLTLPYARFLIDCGEGTQMQLMRYRIKANRIARIFITHLHGDHYLGLVGLLSTMHLLKRTQDLHIHAPRELAEIIRVNLYHSQTVLHYPVHFHPVPLQGGEVIYDDGQYVVETLLMNHRIPCLGYLFRENPRKRRVLTELLPPGTHWRVMAQLKEGQDVHEEGQLRFRAEDYTYRPPSFSFAHCADTLYSESILPQIEGVNLLYHESTFLHEDLEKAEATFHSTARQAALLAQKASVGKLVIGHFSARYRDLTPFLEEAKNIFPATELAIEGETITLREENEPTDKDEIADIED